MFTNVLSAERQYDLMAARSGKPPHQHFAALLDQALSSLSNVVFTLLAAHVLTVTEFGRASLLIGASIVAIGVQRALVTEPFMMSTVPGDGRAPSLASTLSGAALLVCLLFAPVLVLGGTYSTGQVLGMSIALGCGLPALGVADAFRMICFRRGAAWDAVVLDGIWVTVQLGSATVLFATGQATGAWLAVGWVGGGLAAALYALSREHVLPSASDGMQWVFEQSRLGKPLAVDFLSGQGAAQLSLVAVAAVAGAAQVTDIKLVQVALGPFAVLVQAFYNSSMPQLLVRSTEQRWRFACGLGAAFGLVGSMCTAAILLCPPAIARAIFGDVWEHRTTIIILIGVQYVVVAYTVPHSWLLQLQHDVAGPAMARLLNGIVTVVLAVICGSLWGGVGAAAALFTSAACMSAYLYVRSSRSVASSRRGGLF